MLTATVAHFMAKKNIALVTGGDSDEYVISMASARMIREQLDPSRYRVYTILIHKGRWVYTDEGKDIPVNKNDFSIQTGEKKVLFDCVFITIHGTPGEDGRLQAYFDLTGIPYNTAGVMASALTFNKYYCYQVVSRLGFAVPEMIRMTCYTGFTEGDLIARLGLPVFVKPNEGGSSLGMSLVRKPGSLSQAIDLAFRYDREVLVEEYIAGVELTCGVFQHGGKVKALPVTEIVSKTAASYFDYEAKYTPGAADEITPARIPDALTRKVQDVSVLLYQQLGLFGLTRFDYIHRDDTLYFLEVNVTPGMTPTSIVPQQAAVEGISCRELFTMLIEEALSGR